MNKNDQLKELLKRTVAVAHYRSGDISTEDGTFAATDLDQMIYLERAIHDYFEHEASDILCIFDEINEMNLG